MLRLSLGVLVALAITASSGLGATTVSKDVEPYLVEGRIGEGIAFFAQRASTDDPEAQYALGLLQTLGAVEGLTQDLYRYGLKTNSPDLPFVRLPVPMNAAPDPITYAKWRAVLQDFIDDLQTAQTTLKSIEADEVKLKLPVGLIRLDFNGDGQASDEETFWVLFTAVAGVPNALDADQQRYDIGFDKADVHWLIGYTHLLQAMGEAWLAYDTEVFYAATAPMFFEGAKTPGLKLEEGSDRSFSYERIADAIAIVHLASFKIEEPERMQAAHAHLQQVIDESRKTWDCIARETDDDREWIPGAKQTSITPLRVNQEQVDGWKLFLDEADAVLAGKKLIPHWRAPKGRGINLYHVFHHPRDFDLVMWAHGAAAEPYLSQGEVVSPATSRTLQRMFQGNFFSFAVWFN